MDKYALVLLILFIATSSCINLELPKLVKTSFKGNSLPPINVTMGEKFSLPLPHFDSPWESESFEVYEMQEE